MVPGSSYDLFARLSVDRPRCVCSGPTIVAVEPDSGAQPLGLRACLQCVMITDRVWPLPATLVTTRIVQGMWSHQPCNDVSADPRLRPAEPYESIIVGPWWTENPCGASMPLRSTAWRQPGFDPSPMQLVRYLPTTEPNRLLRHVTELQHRTFGAVQDALKAIAERLQAYIEDGSMPPGGNAGQPSQVHEPLKYSTRSGNGATNALWLIIDRLFRYGCLSLRRCSAAIRPMDQSSRTIGLYCLQVQRRHHRVSITCRVVARNV